MSGFYPKKQGLYDPEFEKDSCGVGFVCNIKGTKSNEIVKQGLEVLKRLSHRGATGADPKTGDGAGILIQTPHKFFERIAKECKITLPPLGEYGTGLVFLPSDKTQADQCKKIFEDVVISEGQTVLFWRKVPVDNSVIGKTAIESEPVIEQIFITKNFKGKDQLSFERKLYIIRKKVENAVRSSKINQKSYFYITNLSCRTFSFKGLLMPDQVEKFFMDINDSSIESSLCLVHSRYSTNTFPTWDLAQPFRFLAHNGEINTLRGNINWMRARESLLKFEEFGDINNLSPIIVPGGSDSAAIDNALELLVLSGRSLPHAMMMLIPSAWEHNNLLETNVRDFYKYHACLSEPWDGPAAMAFTDGKNMCALLDRNGLRPARYIVTKSDTVVMASEVGVLDMNFGDIEHSGRLEPGKIFFIDTEAGKIINDSELKEKMATQKPYGKWLSENLIDLDSIPKSTGIKKEETDTFRLLKTFGYTREDTKTILKPMAETGQEPVGSMGNDTPISILSKRPQLLYTYFKQLFAQVTNPAIDPIREECVMSLETYLGPEKNLLVETPEQCKKIRVKCPILSNDELLKLKTINSSGFKTKTISTLFDVSNDSAFINAIDSICTQAEQALKDGYTFIILSDKGTTDKLAALPALVATGAVHQHLVKKSLRSQLSIIVESAEPREVHHFGVLFGYGANLINPYLAYDALSYMITDGEIKIEKDKAEKNYIKAVYKGLQKILSKMGISTLQSYTGAQIFEALGIGSEVIDRCFSGTPSRIGGIDFAIIAKETLLRHADAYPQGNFESQTLTTGGLFAWKKDGEFHLWNPESIAALQDAASNNDYQKFKEFTKLINDQTNNPTTLRGMLQFKKTTPISIDEVESEQVILKRFATGAMSFGSISKEAHESLAIAMNSIGAMSNTGEGGEDPARFKPYPNGDLARSAIKQVASGRFGVTTNYLTNADEIQIKVAQGAKPGEGGQLPGHKVSVTIARTRYTTPGVTLISPPPHHDIYSIEDLAQLIFDLKNANPRARISVKLVSEVGVGTVAAGVAKGHADMILISGGDGGTGASPLSSIKNAGLPWELGLSETHQTLVLNNLRSRVRLQTDGQMRTGRDVAIAALLGAEEYGFCTAALITLGCVMLRHCHLNNCSLGVATQDDALAPRFRGKPEYVVNFIRFVVRELREVMAQLGMKNLNEMIGRTDLLEANTAILPWKAANIDFSNILYKPQVSKEVGIYKTINQDHGIDKVLDRELITLAKPALETKQRVTINLPIHNYNRTTGAMLSGEICRIYGEQALPENTIHCKFNGYAGQSFGAFLSKGVNFELEGLANDYVGKGISGGKIIIYPPKEATYVPQDNIIIGNTTFYGAICGEAYIRGVAGERFCIRNSGLNAVVEGVGDHGCEYMTGGNIVILGKTGRNFAAGMSGGAAYIYDVEGTFKQKCNMEMVAFDPIEKCDTEIIKRMLEAHYEYTQSTIAKKVLDSFELELKKFIKVMPTEYKRILETTRVQEKLDQTEVSDG